MQAIIGLKTIEH